MSRFEMSAEQAAEWRQQLHDLVAGDVNGEKVLSAAAFRRGGATASMVASKAQLGGIVYAGIKMLNKKKAGGLPERVVLAVTPGKLYAFNLGFKGRSYKNKGEVGVWDRAGLKVATAPASGMTALTIESPAEGEKATLVGIGIKDDPVSQELIEVLQGSAPAAG
jgi:hypothetical protein